MPKMSAGLLVYRGSGKTLEVFLVHPGGPFWKNKDAGAWSIPKGEYAAGEDALAAARREFSEETGFALKAAEFKPLGEIRQVGGVWPLSKTGLAPSSATAMSPPSSPSKLILRRA